MVPATEVIVHIDADTISKRRARTLHVQVTSQEGTLRLDRTAALFGDPPEVTFPTKVPVVPEGQDATRTFTIRAQLLDQNQTVFNDKAALLSFDQNKLIDVDLFFSDLCIGIACPNGQTCDNGKCVDIRTINLMPSADAQAGACGDALCWEHPRPTGETLRSACLWAPDAGLVMGDTALRLVKGLWVQESVPPPISSVTAVVCWADGEAIAANGPSILERSTTGTWTRTPMPGLNLNGAWGASPADVWVVGDMGQVLRRQKPGPWVNVASGVSANLNWAWGSSGADVYAVGASGTMLHYDGHNLGPVMGPNLPSANFSKIAGTAPAALAIVADGNVVTESGGPWSSPLALDPYGTLSIAGSSTGMLVAGNARGSAYFQSHPGGPWITSSPAFPDGAALWAAAAFGSAAVLAGDAGALARWNGSTWDSALVSLTTANLHGIANDPSNLVHAVAVGDGGAVLERVLEGVWRRRVVGQGARVVEPDLAAVVMTTGLDIAVGAGGVIAESSTGKDWNVVPSGTSQNLSAVDVVASVIVAGGAAGTLVERSAGGWTPYVPAIPTMADVVVLRGAPDGSIVVGAADGSVFRRAPGGAWASLGTVGAAITDLRIDSGGGVWVSAAGAYTLQNGSFVPFPTSSLTGTVRGLLLQGTVPKWITTDVLVYERQSDGSYASVGGPPMNALSATSAGRVFLVGDLGSILVERGP
jgi:hypothetical protein